MKILTQHSAVTSNTKRTAARISAVQTLYSMAINNRAVEDAVNTFILDGRGADLGDFTLPVEKELYKKIVYGVTENDTTLANIANTALAARTIERQEIIVAVLLKAGIYELRENGKMDRKLIISEYVGIAQMFFDKKKSGFINAVLDTLAKKIRPS